MEEGKKKKKRTVGDLIRTVILIAALAVFCYSGYQLFHIYMVYKEGKDEYASLEKQYVDIDIRETPAVPQEMEGELVMQSPVDFDSLKEVNPEIIGWLYVEALDISYPIAQGEDNDYYLHNTFERTPNIAGCIFLDCENKKKFTDRNSVIYGHNMKNQSMFGKLKQFKEGAFDESPYFWVYTPDQIYKYEIFACHDVGYTSKTYQLTFEDDQDFMDYIKEAFDNSVVSSDASVSEEDTVVTLSTCTGVETTRFIVQGKRIETYKALKGTPHAGEQ